MIFHEFQNKILNGDSINDIYYHHSFQKASDLIRFKGRRNEASVGGLLDVA